MVVVRGCRETERSRRVFKSCCQEWNTKAGCGTTENIWLGRQGARHAAVASRLPTRSASQPGHHREWSRSADPDAGLCWGRERGGVAERSSAQEESSAGRAGSRSCRAGRVGWKSERHAAGPVATPRTWSCGLQVADEFQGVAQVSVMVQREGQEAVEAESSTGTLSLFKTVAVRHGIACTAVPSKARLARVAGGGRTWDQS